jgi:ribosomal protein L20
MKTKKRRLLDFHAGKRGYACTGGLEGRVADQEGKETTTYTVRIGKPEKQRFLSLWLAVCVLCGYKGVGTHVCCSL